MDILKQLYWFLLTLGALIAPALTIYNIFRIISFWEKYWPKLEPDHDERKGNTLHAKRIAFCAVPVIIFFGLVSIYRLGALLINPPDAPSLFGGGVDFRVHYLAFVGLATFLVALIGLPFALFRYEALERQTLAQEEGLITDRINKAVEALGAEKTVSRMGRTVDFEGTEEGIHQQRTIIQWRDQNTDKQFYNVLAPKFGDWTVFNETLPNLEVRIGAIYALERIAQDSLRDHIQIMEILCAYIRQNAPASEAPDLPKPPKWFSMMGDNGLLWGLIFDAWRKKHREALSNTKPRADIQTALTVIGRRRDKQKAKEWGSKESYAQFQKGPPEFPDFQADKTGAPTQGWRDVVESWQRELGEWKQLKPAYRLDLRETNLRKADMSGQSQKADFSHARFEGADVQRADLVGAEAQGAVFVGAQSQGADFRDAQAQGAVFGRAQAQGANFSQVQGAEFRFAQAQGAEFRFARGANFWYAQVQGAVFSQAQGADFRYAQAQGAEFRYAVAQGADFGDAQAQGADFWEAKFDEKTKFSATEFLSIALKSDISMLKLTQEQVNAAFGDGFTAAHLPDGLTKPDHWPDWEMNPFEFDEEWRKWQREGTAYKPPPAPVE